jgi:hypothetical protein
LVACSTAGTVVRSCSASDRCSAALALLEFSKRIVDSVFPLVRSLRVR